MQNKDKLMVYTDGACAPSNPGPCAWGAVLVSNGEVLSKSCGFLGHGTNQIAEISAAVEGLRMTPPGATIELVSDSQYVLKGISEWRAGWERNNWKNSKKEPVANQEQWKDLFKEVDQRTVQTRWVKGHSGEKFNEMADQAANEGLTKTLPALKSTGAAQSVVKSPEDASPMDKDATGQHNLLLALLAKADPILRARVIENAISVLAVDLALKRPRP
jgi:ribonuclease HI